MIRTIVYHIDSMLNILEVKTNNRLFIMYDTVCIYRVMNI